jgi:hypothetical protein
MSADGGHPGRRQSHRGKKRQRRFEFLDVMNAIFPV